MVVYQHHHLTFNINMIVNWMSFVVLCIAISAISAVMLAKAHESRGYIPPMGLPITWVTLGIMSFTTIVVCGTGLMYTIAGVAQLLGFIN